MTTKLLILATLLAAGCSESDRSRATVRVEPQQPPRRVIAPPTGTVRSLPPHAIRADGVGPYRLGEKVSSVMSQLPSGPRIARLEIPGVVRTSVIRAEDGAVLIGGETTSTAMFVAVVGPEVARTDSNVHVGSSLDELVRAAGPLAEDLEHARDPRLVVPAAPRNARIVLEGDRIAAIVVVVPPDRVPVKLGPPPEAECRRPAGSGRKQVGACLSGAGELIDLEEEEIVVHPADSERVLHTLRVPGLVFAAPLRSAGDGRDELVVVARLDEPQRRTWTLAAYRFEGTRLVRTIEPEVVYELSSAQSRWIGAELRDVELYLELASRPDAIEVGGVLVARAGERVRDVALAWPKVVTRRHHKAPGDAQDAGTGDAKTAAGASDGPAPQ